MAIRSDGHPIQMLLIVCSLHMMVHRIGWQSDRMTIRSSVLYRENFSRVRKFLNWDKSHNIYSLLDAHYTDNNPFIGIVNFSRESKIHKALTDKTIVYESHVRRFWSSERYEEKEKMIYSAVRKKDENGQDVDLEIKYNVGDLKRVFDLGDSDNDPTIIPERLCKGLWCRMGFTGRLNGKMIKTMFSKPYKFMIHCVVHALSHRKGAYDVTSDYIMNIITCPVLNMPYNVSQVIFNYLVENVGAGNSKYIMYPRFIMMMIDDLVKDIPKDDDDVLGLRNMTADTISKLAKGPEPRVRRMICKIDNPAYVAPENDAWRHENSNSENEDDKMNEMVEKKLRYWFVKDGKRKRTPKTSPVVPIPKEPTPNIVVKGPSKEPQSSLIDEPMVNPTDLSQLGIDLKKATFEQYIKITEAATAKDRSTSVQVEGDKEKQAEEPVHEESEDADDESIETEPEIDMSTIGRGKVQMKKKPQKKKKASDEEDSTYTPTGEEKKKLRIKRKAVQTGVIPRNVRSRKGGALLVHFIC
ncbi:hypothetical protein Hanom_Chr07g00635141 [Helianthus anomalus]